MQQVAIGDTRVAQCDARADLRPARAMHFHEYLVIERRAQVDVFACTVLTCVAIGWFGAAMRIEHSFGGCLVFLDGAQRLRGMR